MTRPAILFGGPSPEHDISVLTGLQAVAALGKTGTFEAISGGDWLAYTIVPSSFLYALGGAAIASLARFQNLPRSPTEMVVAARVPSGRPA